jgi:hypothetical protein
MDYFHINGRGLSANDSAVCTTVSEHHATLESQQALVAEFTVNADFVFFSYAVTRMCHTCGKCAIIGQQQQSG